VLTLARPSNAWSLRCTTKNTSWVASATSLSRNNPPSRALWLVVFTCTALRTWAGHAQDVPRAQVSPSPALDYSFEDDQVLGDSVSTNGSLLTTRTRGARESLVRARMHFVVELCRAVEQL
jgi:hypothetical protein